MSESILFIVAASHPSSAVRSAAFSLPPSAPVAVAVQIVFRQEECAGAAHARSVEAFAAAEKAHSDWAQADCSAALENDWVRAVVPAGLWPVGSVLAESVPRDWALPGCSGPL